MKRSAMCISVQQAKHCTFSRRTPRSDHGAHGRVRRTVITVHGTAKCTTSNQGRSLCRSVDEAYLDRVRAYHTTEAYKKAYRKRSVWVEPLFAEAKDWHGLRRFRLRELWRVNCEALRIATGQNLKRLLKKRGWGRRPFPAEAVFALFLAASGWSIPHYLGEVSLYSCIDSASLLSKRECLPSCC